MTKQKEKQGYLSDRDLYILWILTDAEKLLGKSRIRFSDLTAVGSREILTVSTTKHLSRAFGFTLKDFELVRGKFAFDGFCKAQYEKNKEFCQRLPDSPLSKALEKIHSGKFGFEEVERANTRLNDYIEFIEFSPEIGQKVKKEIRDFLLRYIADYANDELALGKENYYDFVRQLHFTYGLMKKYIDRYGNSFVFEFAPMRVKENELPEPKNDLYLPIHNLLAFQYSDFIEIDRIWISDWEVPPEEQMETYKVRLKIKLKFFDFFGNVDPKLTYEFGPKPEVDSDPTQDQIYKKLDFEDGTLFFANKEIIISQRADSDAHELLRTIFKDRAKLWSSDEVLDDWQFDYTKSKIPKNKVYQAGKAVNRIVAQHTTIQDFLKPLTTKNVAINKKYLIT